MCYKNCCDICPYKYFLQSYIYNNSDSPYEDFLSDICICEYFQKVQPIKMIQIVPYKDSLK